MLADPKFQNLYGDPIKEVLAMISEGDPKPQRLRRGAYLIGHFNFDFYLTNAVFSSEDKGDWFEYPDLDDFSCYGVCDSPDQFFNHGIGKFIIRSPKLFVVGFTKVAKAERPSSGGWWRWHKWGPYIGDGDPRCEYLYDESERIQDVYVYHVYECLNALAILENDTREDEIRLPTIDELVDLIRMSKGRL